MSEKKGPFDAAIKILRDSTIRLRAFNIKPNDIDFAIRVLEVAGKMDKQYCIEVFEMFVKNTALGPYDDIRYRKDGLAIFPVSQLRALLEVLPEKEEK